VINGITGFPGRKLAVLFSDGFPLIVTDNGGARVTSDILEPLRRLIDLANRSSVVIYAIDPRGLQPIGLSAADRIVSRNPGTINAKVETRREALYDTQAGLSFLAEGTGGLAIKNQNDLNLGLQRILEDKSYYLVGYEPDVDTF
jgi:VWFA-related protein